MLKLRSSWVKSHPKILEGCYIEPPLEPIFIVRFECLSMTEKWDLLRSGLVEDDS